MICYTEKQGRSLLYQPHFQAEDQLYTQPLYQLIRE